MYLKVNVVLFASESKICEHIGGGGGEHASEGDDDRQQQRRWIRCCTKVRTRKWQIKSQCSRKCAMKYGWDERKACAENKLWCFTNIVDDSIHECKQTGRQAEKKWKRRNIVSCITNGYNMKISCNHVNSMQKPWVQQSLSLSSHLLLVSVSRMWLCSL